MLSPLWFIAITVDIVFSLPIYVKRAKQAENNFNELIEEVAISQHPIVISGEKYNALFLFRL